MDPEFHSMLLFTKINEIFVLMKENYKVLPKIQYAFQSKFVFLAGTLIPSCVLYRKERLLFVIAFGEIAFVKLNLSQRS